MSEGQHETKEGKKSLVAASSKEFATLAEAEKVLGV
jgi:hypothetical protein